MASYYDAVDILWTDDGDLQQSDDGDIADSSFDKILSLRQDLVSIVRSSLGDWKLHPNLATGLREFAGRPNTPETARLIESRLRSSISLNGIANEKDIYVRIVPIKWDAVLCILSVEVIATPENSLDQDGRVTIAFMFDLTDGRMIFMESTKQLNYFPVGGR
jgi:hypothetical protein